MVEIKLSIRWFVALVVLSISFLLLSLQIGATGIEQLESESSELKAKLAGINEEIIDLSLEIEEVLVNIEKTESDIKKTQEILGICKEDEAEQHESMKLRIRYMYENGQTSMLEILLGAKSIEDFINRSELVNAMTQYDRDMLKVLVDTREEIEFEEQSLEKQKVELEKLEKSSKLKQEQLESKASETQTDITKIQKEITAIKEAERIAAEKAEAERIAAEKAAAEANGGTSEEVGKQESTAGSYAGSDSELDVFAAILDCEARSNYESMLAVATVIMNRVNSSKFANSITGVVYQKGQFSPVTSGKLNRVLATGASSLAYKVAQDAMNGSRLSSVSHCYYFLMASSTSRDGVSVGGNLFFASW